METTISFPHYFPLFYSLSGTLCNATVSNLHSRFLPQQYFNTNRFTFRKVTIQNYYYEKHPICQQIAPTLSSIDTAIILCWILSHSNISKNHQADNSVKESLLMSPIRSIPIPLTDLKNSEILYLRFFSRLLEPSSFL